MKKMTNQIANDIKFMILMSGYTQSEVVDMMSARFGWSHSTSNFSRKINEGTLRYNEALELAQALGYEIRWERVKPSPYELASKKYT